MPGGTLGTLLVIAACLGAAAYCFSRVSWPLTPTFPQVLWIVAGCLFLIVGVIIAAVLIAARIG